MADLTMYGADWCPDCRRSKRLLERLGVPYVLRDVEHDPAAAEQAQAVSGRQSIPVIVLPDGSHLVEPSDRDLQRNLEAAGLIPA